MKYLFLDNESGGRNDSYSILTSYLMVTDEQFNVLGELSLEIKPDDGNYILSGTGMSVNKINLQEHDKIAISYKQAKSLLYEFLKKHAGNERLTPVGHGTKGDILTLQKYLISEGSWEQFCTYHYIDTSVVLQFLRSCGKMPMDCDGSVEALCKYFRINQNPGDDAQYHNAKFDTQMTAAIFQKMVELGSLVPHFREI